jgi:uncharacterized phage-associated protein
LTLPGFVPILFLWEDPMEDSRVVANYMLDVAARRGVPMTNLKLQKLLFFAHAISLTEQKVKLVSGYFEAWQYGPVHPTVYQAFKAAGPEPISFRADSLDPVSRTRKPLPNLSESATRDICERVMVQFGQMSAGRLVDVTHAVGGPWHYVVSSSEAGANIGLRIPDEIIIERHGRQKVSVTPTPRVGEPNEDTPLVGNRSC